MTGKKIFRFNIMSLILLAFLLSGFGQAGIVSIAPEESIQEAIDKSLPGDIIEIQSGTYFENVNVTKPLVIRGVDTGNGFPTVNAQGRGSAVTLFANGIALEHLNLMGAGGWEEAGIKVRSNGCTIINNKASSKYGIGIYLLKANDNILINNEIFDNDFGIALNHSSDNILKNNSLHNNKNNFLSGYGPNEIDTSNKIEGRPLYYLVNKSDIVIDSGSNAGNVYCISCNNITIKDLNINYNFAGVYFQDTINSQIISNTLRDNSMGISLIDSSNCIIRDNFISDNIYGIYVKNASINNTITGNNVSNNDFGIFLTIEDEDGWSNIIFNNTLIDSKKDNAYSRGTAQWDNGSKGNRYSNYDQVGEGCSDSDGNGICDRPYKIRGGPGIDKYPILKGI